MHLSQSVPVIEIHHDNVGPEFCLVGTEETPVPLHVGVQLLESLQALGQVLVVDLGIKHHHVLRAQLLRAEDVEADTLLNQLHHLLVAQLLLSNLLANAAGSVPKEVVPLCPLAVISRRGNLRQQVVHGHGQHRQWTQFVRQWLILVSG